MIDFDAIWRFQDEVRTVVNACLGDDELALLSSQLTLPADYDGEGFNGSMFVIYPW